jgi:hypothetical protein
MKDTTVLPRPCARILSGFRPPFQDKTFETGVNLTPAKGTRTDCVAPKLANHDEPKFATYPFLWQIAIETFSCSCTLSKMGRTQFEKKLVQAVRLGDDPSRKSASWVGPEIGRWLWRQAGAESLKAHSCGNPFDIEAEDWLGAKSYLRFGWSLQIHRPLPILRLKISLRVTDNEWRDKQELVKLGLVLQEDPSFCVYLGSIMVMNY